MPRVLLTAKLTLIRHTSGTTGMPKPIIWTHETCNQVLNAKVSKAPSDSSSVEGDLVNGKRVIVTLPPFHVRHLELPAEADDFL